MRKKLDEDLFYTTPGTLHYNVCFIGGVVRSRVTARGFKDLDPKLMDWVYIIEARRRATAEEIAALCKKET